MKILIVGGGGREHALAWKCAQSPRVERVYVAPGNAGTAGEARCENVAVAAGDIAGLLAFARGHGVDLTLIGPEAPLVQGVVDAFREAGLRCFGPVRAAARLEGSKAYAKDFMQRHGIPTAAYGVFSDYASAAAFIQRLGAPVVVKADGLASGKGVVVAETEDMALLAARDMLDHKVFGEAGARVVVEEFLPGEEASFIVLADGEHALALASSQDHKRLMDGDHGPNTGGMGAYSPAPAVTPDIHERVMREVIGPVLAGMRAEGHPYVGFLYAGLMIGLDGTPKVLEFNCRFGDPETQPILLRLQSDLTVLVEAALDGRLDAATAEWDERAALGVVLAARGYPGAVTAGDAIRVHGPDPLGVKVFHAGTAIRDGALVTAGGRVLCVTALGADIVEARWRAYRRVEDIRFEGAQHRSDIGHRALGR